MRPRAAACKFVASWRLALTLVVPLLLMLCGTCFNLLRPKQDPCPFCHVSKNEDFDVVMEDSDYVMFKDKWPAAVWHYLVIPKAHIGSVRDLGVEDVELVQAMLAMGERFLDSEQVPKEERRFGFHIPPFASIDHLHLHCFGLPFKSKKASYKYRISRRQGPVHSKGWGWYIEVDQVIQTLKNGGRVTFSPC